MTQTQPSSVEAQRAEAGTSEELRRGGGGLEDVEAWEPHGATEGLRSVM